MSSRALRKLQREQELQRQVEAAKTAHEHVEESEESEEEDADVPLPSVKKPINAFDMLEDVQDDESDLADQENDPDSGENTAVQARVSEPITSTPIASKPKKKKKKGKKKQKTTETTPSRQESGDEIDRAIKEVVAKDGSNHHQQSLPSTTSHWEATATKLLAIDAKHLNPVNEMRTLFGSIALEGQESRSTNRAQRQREANQQGGVDLATALTGRYSAASKGKELGVLANRRNVFIQGREEWPLATSGGLSMAHEQDNSFEKKYDILHNNLYSEVQMHFRMAVQSMDPQRMIGLLTMNPYHIATLLQVSEIAKHQGDHSVSGDLLERALFSFGRSVHSSFPAALRAGTARISFDKQANRELYLSVWRYIKNLEMRGTWRTAFEWSKILLQFNTLSDPYGVTLMIDQLALRGRQHEQLLSLASDGGYADSWQHLPNIQISLTLAYLRSARPRDARRQLAIAMHKYPYILSALASALDISPIPKSLWAKLPSTDAEKLYTELYVLKAKDLWNTPETTALIAEVAETLEHYSEAMKSSPPPAKLEISLEEARHIMLLETPSLLAILPRKFTNMPTSSSDVLPPPDSASDFVSRAPANGDQAGAMQALFNAAGATAGATGGLLQRVLNWFHAPAGPSDTNGESEGQQAYRDLQQQLGGEVPPEMIEQLLRMHMHEADENQEQITAQGLGMAGAWDDYEDTTSGADDNDSMPELEDVPTENSSSAGPPTEPTSTTRRNPHAAMVEEDIDEDQDNPTTQTRRGPTHALLRHVDSDDEETAALDSDGVAPHPSQPRHTLFTSTTGAARVGQRNRQPQTQTLEQISNSASRSPPQPQPNSSTNDPSSTTTPTELDESDPQRVQRWLITTGLTELQADPNKLAVYVRRLKILRKQQQDWTVQIVRQRAGADVVDCIRNALG